jgi:hypothetical protein
MEHRKSSGQRSPINSNRLLKVTYCGNIRDIEFIVEWNHILNLFLSAGVRGPTLPLKNEQCTKK